MYLRSSIAAGMRAINFTLLLSLASACTSAQPQPPALLSRPERPVLSTAQEIQAEVQEKDILGLTRLYARDMAELMAYARKLEALLDAVERQNRK